MVTASTAFHDLQNGGYTRDLPYFSELARRADSTLELGAGAGRVALELAALTDLWVNDLDEQLLDALLHRAEARGLFVTPVPGDATTLDLGRRFDLILAPVGFVQIIGDRSARRALLGVIADHLAIGGQAVVAVSDVDEVLRECATPAPRRRLRARGRTYVSRQVAATRTDGGVRVVWERAVLRRTAGRLARRPVAPTAVTYRRVSASDLAADAGACGLRVPHAHHDAGDAASLGATYCVLQPLLS